MYGDTLKCNCLRRCQECFDRDGTVSFVPDLCVEVLLDSDLPHEMGRRVASYLEGGAKEVIVVKQDGAIEFWGAAGRRQASTFAITLSVEPVYCPASASVSAVDLHHRAAERTAAATRDAGCAVGAVAAEAGNANGPPNNRAALAQTKSMYTRTC
jgi:hypothetical protein